MWKMQALGPVFFTFAFCLFTFAFREAAYLLCNTMRMGWSRSAALIVIFCVS